MMLFPANLFLAVSLVLVILGLWAIFVLRHNLILVLVSVEMILLASNLLFGFFSLYFDDIMGQVFSLYILMIAAAESAIGLAILVAYYRLRSSISMEVISFLKG